MRKKGSGPRTGRLGIVGAALDPAHVAGGGAPGRQLWLPWAAGAVILAALLAFAVWDPGQGTRAFFLLLGIAATGYLVAVFELARGWRPSSRVLMALALVAFVWRVPFVLAPMHPRADVTRYLWDARAVRAGVSPYAVPPADPAVAYLRTPESWPVNNADIPSPYPPGAQVFFLLATALGDSALAVKACLLVCEALLAVTLRRWLLAIGACPGWLLAYLWNPLVTFEVARQGHVDALGALFLVLAVLALAQRRTLGGAVALALAMSVKPLPLVLAPMLWRRVSLRDAVAGLSLLAMLYVPFLAMGGTALGSAPEVVHRFRFNGPVFEAVASASSPLFAATLATSVGLSVAAWARARLPAMSPAAWSWPLAATLLCAPLVYPWYLVWLAPFLVARSTVPLLVWTVSIQVVYLAWVRPAGTPWAVPPWALLAEYCALVIAGAWARHAAKRSGRWQAFAT